ncbi:MAG: hypothetical protein LBG84_05135 [Treponema sp.]|nr:hypothetical protein [Treponema sp.]
MKTITTTIHNHTPETAARRRRLAALIFGLLCLPGPRAGAEYFYPDSEEIKTIEHLARRAGKVPPFSSFPVHGSDLLDFAEELSAGPGAARFGEADRAALDNLTARLESRRENIRVAGTVALAYEQRLSSNSFTIDDPRTEANAEDFRRAFLDMPPVIALGASAGTFTGPWVSSLFDIRPAWTGDYNPGSNFFKSIYTLYDITNDITRRGVLAWNGRYVNFFLGRDAVHWGEPAGSTLYPSKLLPYLDSVRLNVPLGPFSLDYLLGSVVPKKANHDVYWDDPENTYRDHLGFMDDPNPSSILVAAHRFQWNFGALKAGIGGTVVLVRANNAFHLTDFLPLLVYHNTGVEPKNLNMVLDASWAAFPGFSVSAMLGFDDINARIFGIPDGDVPTIPGAIVQADYSAAREGMVMNFHLEGGGVHYLWGSHSYDEPPFTQPEARLARAIFRYNLNHYGKGAELLPLTSPYGPGVVWGRFSAGFAFSRRRVKAGLDLLALTKNRDVNLVDTRYSLDDPTRDSERIWYAEARFPLSYTWEGFEFSLRPGLRFGARETALECSLGLRFTLAGEADFGGP